MKNHFTYLSSILLIGYIAAACSSAEQQTDYIQSVEQWHQERIESLTQPYSWLSLVGFYWLEPGINTFGADSTNDLIFPGKETPDHIGRFVVEDSTITVSIADGVPVMHQQDKVSELRLQSDAEGEPTILTLGSLRWFVIKRSGQFAVRLKNSNSDLLQNFQGVESFPITKSWKVKATFEPYDQPKTVSIPTFVGKPTTAEVPGELVFSIEGQKYRLAPFQTDGNEFFVVFGDKTNGKQTYGGGRFVYVTKAGADNITYIDFNKSYNPPCAFTPYSTCPLPTPKNRLAVAIEAGEKQFKGGYH